MELTETIERINSQLIDLFGIDTLTGQAMWRVVWSEDQFEHRRGIYEDYTKNGIFLRRVEEVRYVPKYSQWIRNKYVLERLVIVPDVNAGDLPAVKLTYEPIFPFQTGSGEYLPPRLDACQFVINSVLAVQGKGNLAKYKDPMAGLTTEEQIEAKQQELDALEEELFGNETDTGDALAHNQAIIVPRNYTKES